MSEETALTPFEFENQPVRVIRNENDDPWFVAADVCRALGYANTSQSVADHVDTEDKVYLQDRGGISQTYTPGSTLVISESGVYALIFGSQKPEAKRFKKWVTSEVLPAIRRTGQYTARSLTPLEQLEATVAIMREQQAQLTAHDQRLRALESQVQREPEHFTIMGYCILRGLPVPSRNEAQSMGQRAVKLSRVMGQATGKTTDPRYGVVNTYHVSVLDELYKG
jgi:prophage antirepressor-like protein